VRQRPRCPSTSLVSVRAASRMSDGTRGSRFRAARDAAPPRRSRRTTGRWTRL
jgi:hypothetical protein